MTGHSKHPHHIDNQTWFYDDTGGMLIVREVRDENDNYLRTEQFKIRWQSVMAAAKRHLEEMKK